MGAVGQKDLPRGLACWLWECSTAILFHHCLVAFSQTVLTIIVVRTQLGLPLDIDSSS